MGKYTIYNQAWIDRQIQEHIDLAVERIKQKINGIRSIILVGGFGRGEGSVKIENNQVCPLNDYDIYVILDGKLKVSEDESNQLMNEIEKTLGTSGFSLYEDSSKSFYFDIRFLNCRQLSNLAPFIKYYEMKHASYILFGDDIRDLIPDFQPNELPISEGLRFMLNRLSSIFLWTPIDLLLNRHLPEWQKDAILYDVSKSYIEIGTALTQLAKVYAPTYRKRLENLKKIYSQQFPDLEKDCPGLLEKIGYYTDLKLRPEYQSINNHLEHWFSARDDLLKAIAFVLSKHFNADFNNFTSQVCRKYFRPYLSSIIGRRLKIKKNKFLIPVINVLAQSYLTIIWFFRVIHFRKKVHFRILLDYKDPGIKIFNSLILIIKSLNKNGTVDIDSLEKGINILKKVYPLEIEISDRIEDFKKINLIYINAWKLYYFQKIV